MEQHLSLTDFEFEKQFETCTLSPLLFTHEAHLRLAWIHIKRYGPATAIRNVTKQLKTFVSCIDAEDKYNHTLTVAAVKAVHHFVNKSQADNFIDFIMAFPRLKYNFKELMSAHYTMDIFQSEEAKNKFLEPDLIPFDIL